MQATKVADSKHLMRKVAMIKSLTKLLEKVRFFLTKSKMLILLSFLVEESS